MWNEFAPAGRLGRGAFWLRHLTGLPLGMWLVVAAGETPGAPWDLVPAAALTLWLVSVWARRLHDRGRSAWWLLAAALPALGALWLLIECGLRGTAAGAVHFGGTPPAPDYLSVQPTERRTA